MTFGHLRRQTKRKVPICRDDPIARIGSFFQRERLEDKGIKVQIGSLTDPLSFARVLDLASHNPLVAGSSPARPTSASLQSCLTSADACRFRHVRLPLAHAGVCHTATQPASGMLRDPFRGEAVHCRNLFGQLAADHALDLAAD